MGAAIANDRFDAQDQPGTLTVDRLRLFLFRLRALFWPRKIEAQLAEEIRIHLEMIAEAHIAAGLPANEAYHLARREFGGVDQIKEAHRSEWRFRSLGRLGQNFRGAVRQVRRNPILTAAIVATLALGIGATTAIYTVIYATLLAPLPVANPDQVVMVWSKVGGSRDGMSAGDFLEWRRQSTSFERLAAFAGSDFNLARRDEPEVVHGRLCTPGFYSLLGLPFLLGRDFLPEEETPGKDRVVILGFALWNRLGANRAILGHPIQVNGANYIVVGVLAPSPADRYAVPLTAPLALRPEQINHDYHWLETMGRLKPGVSLGRPSPRWTQLRRGSRQSIPPPIRVGVCPLNPSRTISSRRTIGATCGYSLALWVSYC